MRVAAYSHSIRYYTTLFERSLIEEVSGTEVRVFRGSLKGVYDELGISSTHYKEIQRNLSRQGCLTILRKGTPNAPSVVVLHRAPAREDWVRTSEKDLTDAEDFAKLVGEVERLKNRIGGLNIVEALQQFEERLARLEANNNTLDKER